MRTALIFFLLGAWLMGTVMMWVVATQNFRRVDAVLVEARPELQWRIVRLQEGDARLVLRLLASELNRYYFRAWGIAQLVLGTGLLVLLCWKPQLDSRVVLLTGLMLTLAAALLFLVTPQLLRIGRQIDFVPRTPPTSQLTTFWRYHLSYTLADMTKVGLGLWACLRLARKTRIAKETPKPYNRG